MNLSETALVLAQMQAYDQRTVGESDVIAWHSLLADAPFEDCQEAVRRHYAEQTERIMPAHVRRLVRDIAGEREAAARHTGWAPGQAGVPKDQPMPIELRPSAAEAGLEIKRLALSDLPAAVAELVARVRADLPEGSRDALYPRRAAWEREHAAYLRQQAAEPNPHYRPGSAEEHRCRDCGLVAEEKRMIKHLQATGHAVTIPQPGRCMACGADSDDLAAHVADYPDGSCA